MSEKCKCGQPLYPAVRCVKCNFIHTHLKKDLVVIDVDELNRRLDYAVSKGFSGKAFVLDTIIASIVEPMEEP